MNNKIASLLTVAVMTGLLASQVANADHHEGKGKAKKEHNGCKGKDGCKAEHKAKGKKDKAAPAADQAAPAEEAAPTGH